MFKIRLANFVVILRNPPRQIAMWRCLWFWRGSGDPHILQNQILSSSSFFIQQTPSHESRPKMLMSFHLFLRSAHFTSANCRTVPDFKAILKRANVALVFHTLMCHPVVKARHLGCSCGFQGATDINWQSVYIRHNPTFYSFCLKWFTWTP